MAFRVQVQIRLTGFEKYLDLPTLSIDPNDFFFGEFLIRADESYPIFLLAFVTNTHNLGIDLLLCLVVSSQFNYTKGSGIYAFSIAFIIEFSRFKAPFRCGKF